MSRAFHEQYFLDNAALCLGPLMFCVFCLKRCFLGVSITGLKGWRVLDEWERVSVLLYKQDWEQVKNCTELGSRNSKQL